MMDHTVTAFEDELKALDGKIAQMGGLAEHLLARAIDALEKRDPELAAQTISQDKAIDQLDRDIEELAILIIARRQPVALDLRQILSALRISADLERIGDLGKNIAKRAMAIAGENRPQQLMIGIGHIGSKAMEQLQIVLDAYSQRDAEKAMNVWARDRDLDAIYNSVFRELLTYMMEDPRNIGVCTHLLFGAKNLERIGDHTTNMAESIHFLVKGVSITEDRPKHDTTSFLTPEKMAE
jgi:phosphate transport system protein